MKEGEGGGRNDRKKGRKGRNEEREGDVSERVRGGGGRESQEEESDCLDSDRC